MRIFIVSLVVSMLVLTNADIFSSDCTKHFESRQILLDSSIGKFKMFFPLDYRNDTLFIINPQKSRDKIKTIFSLHEYSNDSLNKYDLVIPYSGIIDIVDLLVNDNFYILLDLQNLWIFNRTNLSLNQKVELPNTLSEMRFAHNNENIIELSFCSISSFNKHNNTQTYAYIYNLSNKEELFFPVNNPDNIEFTYVKRQLQSLQGNLFAVSNPLDYSINIYLLNRSDTIKIRYSKPDWKKPKYDEILIDKDRPKKDIPKLMEVRNNLFMIETIEFMGDDKLIVQWSMPVNEDSLSLSRKKYLDIWKINESDAVIISENIEDKEIYCDNGSYIPPLDRFRYKNGYLYSIKKIPFLTNKLQEGKTIKSQINEFGNMNNTDRFSVYLYNFK